MAVLFRNRRSFAGWCFFAGMTTLAVESALEGISLQNSQPEDVAYWQSLALMTKSFLPGIWLAFSLSYSRGNYREFLDTWKFFLAAALLFPVGILLGFHSELIHLLPPTDTTHGWSLSFGKAGQSLNVLWLISAVMILNNLEKTFRSTVGTMRWRIKFVFLGFAVIFAGRIYSLSQDILYPQYNLALIDFETGSLLIGCSLIGIGYFRNGIAEVDVYPSQSFLQGTVTILLAGGYLFVIGLLAQLIAFLGGAGSFKTQTLVVLLGIAGLAILLLSDRFRQRIQRFVSHHFKRPQHDFRKVWLLFTQRTSGVLDRDTVCVTAVKLISETFNVLSVTIWRVDERKERLVFGASTSLIASDNLGLPLRSVMPQVAPENSQLFNLEELKEEWAENLKEINSAKFRNGGNRICLPLSAGDRWLGWAILADRVNGLSYTVEELDLLKCMGDQIAAVLLNLRLTDELMLAKELEAFQTMSTFFVHDLKNAASTLGLTLQNLPVHFDDPEFRADALRGIENTLNRINLHISRLSALRNKLELKPIASDLNQLIIETLNSLNGMPGVQLVRDFHPLPKVVVDPEQLQSVVANLLLNAREAVGSDGQIRIETDQREGRAILSVTDNGCGMSSDFLKTFAVPSVPNHKEEGVGYRHVPVEDDRRSTSGKH